MTQLSGCCVYIKRRHKASAARPSPIAHACAPAAIRHAGQSGYGMHIYGRGAKQKSGNRMDAALKVVSPRIELGSNL